jgi:hypothetical protein
MAEARKASGRGRRVKFQKGHTSCAVRLRVASTASETRRLVASWSSRRSACTARPVVVVPS